MEFLSYLNLNREHLLVESVTCMDSEYFTLSLVRQDKEFYYLELFNNVYKAIGDILEGKDVYTGCDRLKKFFDKVKVNVDLCEYYIYGGAISDVMENPRLKYILYNCLDLGELLMEICDYNYVSEFILSEVSDRLDSLGVSFDITIDRKKVDRTSSVAVGECICLAVNSSLTVLEMREIVKMICFRCMNTEKVFLGQFNDLGLEIPVKSIRGLQVVNF